MNHLLSNLRNTLLLLGGLLLSGNSFGVWYALWYNPDQYTAIDKADSLAKCESYQPPSSLQKINSTHIYNYRSKSCVDKMYYWGVEAVYEYSENEYMLGLLTQNFLLLDCTTTEHMAPKTLWFKMDDIRGQTTNPTVSDGSCGYSINTADEVSDCKYIEESETAPSLYCSFNFTGTGAIAPSGSLSGLTTPPGAIQNELAVSDQTGTITSQSPPVNTTVDGNAVESVTETTTTNYGGWGSISNPDGSGEITTVSDQGTQELSTTTTTTTTYSDGSKKEEITYTKGKTKLPSTTDTVKPDGTVNSTSTTSTTSTTETSTTINNYNPSGGLVSSSGDSLQDPEEEDEPELFDVPTGASEDEYNSKVTATGIQGVIDGIGTSSGIGAAGLNLALPTAGACQTLNFSYLQWSVAIPSPSWCAKLGTLKTILAYMFYLFTAYTLYEIATRRPV